MHRWLARAALCGHAASLALALWAAVVGTGGASPFVPALQAALVAAAVAALVTTGFRRPLLAVAAALAAIGVLVTALLAGAGLLGVGAVACEGVAVVLHHRWRRVRPTVAASSAPGSEQPGAAPTPAATSDRGTAAAPGHDAARARRPSTRRDATDRGALVVNPWSGDGCAERVGLVDAAAAAGVRTLVLGQDGEDPVALARQAVDDGAEVLGIAGGDGTIGPVAEVAMAHDLALVVVPVGTRNHLALDLGLDRDDPLAALGGFGDADERRIDVGEAGGRVFVNNVSLGVYAALVDHDEYRDAKLSTVISLLPDLWATGGPWFDLQVEVPHHGRLDEVAVLHVSNDPHELLGDVGRRAALDRGVLGLVTVDPDRLADLVELTALTAVGRPEAARTLWSWEATKVEVGSRQPRVVAGVDGERVELDAPITLRSRPAALRVRVPAGTPVGLAEQEPGTGPYADLLGAAIGIAPAGG